MSTTTNTTALLITTLLITALSLLLPANAHAALNAGVVRGIWFSEQPLIPDAKVEIFTAVQNQSDITVHGSVAFLVNDAIVGTAPFSAAHNEIVSVSVDHRFSAGTYTVGAYITSVEEGAVASAIVPSIDVIVAEKTTTASNDVPATGIPSVDATLSQVTDTGKNVIDTVAPHAESAAQAVEAFRDTFLTDASTPEHVYGAATTPQEFAAVSSDIFDAEEVPLWKRLLGIAFSAVALVARYWMWLFVVLFLFFFWRLVRGNRIS